MSFARATILGVIVLTFAQFAAPARAADEPAAGAADAAEKPAAVKAVEAAKTKVEDATKASDKFAQKAEAAGVRAAEAEKAATEAEKGAKSEGTKTALSKAAADVKTAAKAMTAAAEESKNAVKASAEAVKATEAARSATGQQGVDAVKADSAAVAAAKKQSEAREVSLSMGTLSYGVTTTLLRLQSSRKASDPARVRDYQLGIEKLPLDLGFQFSYRPRQRPYRLDTTDGAGFQMISVGGMLSVAMNPQIASQAEVILGFVLSFFDESVSLGLGFDLYRGVPVRGADGAAGSDAAPTGLFGWACSKKGEVTPENFSLLLTFNISKIGGAVGGGK